MLKNFMSKTTKKQTAMKTPSQTLEILTQARMLKMSILESKGYLRLLDDTRISGFYIIFNGKLNASKITSSYQNARREFQRIASIS